MNDEMTPQSEAKIEDQETSYKEKAEEYLNSWKRERAEFLNYKKDEAKRIKEFTQYANEDVILEMLDVLDSLEKARKNVPPEAAKSKDWLEGLDQVIRQFQDVLIKYGIERIKVEDTTFNPLLHEAIEVTAGGERLEEVRAGYLMRDKVIRPARVKIIK